MRQPQFLESALGAWRGEQRKPTIVLLVSTLTLVTWRCYFWHDYYREHLAGRFDLNGDPRLTAAVYSFVGALVLLGIVPALTVKLILREKLSDYGVQLGDRVRTVRSFLLFAPVMVVLSYFASQTPDYQAFYPVNKSACLSGSMFALHAATYFLFYLGWEFQFRGFMQFGLRESMGDANALLVQVLASVLLHVGKPASEFYGSIFGAILWGLLAYRTRSLLSGTLQHFLLGISLDWFVCA
jgi:membrane protease YdiL (CAAX protease family)